MKRFNSILCVVDNEHSFDTAFAQSMKIANDHQAKISFISVIAPPKNWPVALLKKESNFDNFHEIAESRHATIRSWISKLNPTLKANIDVYLGKGFIEIIKCVTKNKHDLVVKCAEDIDWIDRMFGSEDMHLLRKCPCPVLMLKPSQKDAFRKILATVDINEDASSLDDENAQNQLNRQVLEHSAAFCMPELMELHIGSTWVAYAEDFYRYGAFSSLPEEEVNHYAEQVRRDCSDKLEVCVREMDNILGKETLQYLLPNIHLVKGKPSKEIPLMVEKYDIDLIVMGTVGRIGIPGLIIGNTAESILEQVRCSVLAIKPEGFKSPIL